MFLILIYLKHTKKKNETNNLETEAERKEYHYFYLHVDWPKMNIYLGVNLYGKFDK